MATAFDEMNQQTRKKIQEVFITLLKEKDFTKVTVRDITEAATINRGTFYLHYLDKFDLLEKIENQLLEGLKRHLEALNPEDAMKKEKQLEVSGFSIEVFRYIESQSEQFIALLSKNNRSSFLLRLKEIFVERFIENYEASDLKNIDPSIPRDYLAAFAASAILGLLEQWIARTHRETPEEIASLYMKILLFIKAV